MRFPRCLEMVIPVVNPHMQCKDIVALHRSPLIACLLQRDNLLHWYRPDTGATVEERIFGGLISLQSAGDTAADRAGVLPLTRLRLQTTGGLLHRSSLRLPRLDKPVVRKDGSTLPSRPRKQFCEAALASADFAKEINRNREREHMELHLWPPANEEPPSFLPLSVRKGAGCAISRYRLFFFHCPDW